MRSTVALASSRAPGGRGQLICLRDITGPLVIESLDNHEYAPLGIFGQFVHGLVVRNAFLISGRGDALNDAGLIEVEAPPGSSSSGRIRQESAPRPLVSARASFANPLRTYSRRAAGIDHCGGPACPQADSAISMGDCPDGNIPHS